MTESLPSPTGFQPSSVSELSRFLRENAETDRNSLLPVGGRTALHYGHPPAEPPLIVETAKLARTVDYPARDMTVTVEAGMRIDELAELLREESQQLPIDVSQSNRATVGGVVATNTSGPRRYGYGTLRDYVIGVSAVDASGRSFKAGGRVVKNVAGYDLCKLMIGSLGTLSILTQLTLKLKPIPESQSLLWVEFPLFDALEVALQSLQGTAVRPVVVDALTPSAAAQTAAETRADLTANGPVLIVGVEGGRRETDWQLETLTAELSSAQPRSICEVDGESAERVLRALTEFSVNAEEPLTFRSSMPPSQVVGFLQQANDAGIVVHAHAGNGIAAGHLPDDVTDASRARELLSPLHRHVDRHGGGFTILNCNEDWKRDLPVFGTPPGAWALMMQLKQQLDPHGLLNPGRLFGAGDKVTG
ncbi:MAG: FAD-binding oxidoreductase [Planctomycetaceae bacterium]